MKKLTVYLSFPFCMSKCHFCDWVQRVPKKDLFLGPQDSVRKAYVDAICSEIRQWGGELATAGYYPHTIYFGGGTATTATADEMDAMVDALKSTFDMSRVAEWTIEGSPDTVSRAMLEHYRARGFNRFSCGVQSFDEQRLKRLGRLHSREQSIEAIHLARESGFDNISVDLMCGFPDEDFAELDENIRVAAALPVRHISLYTFRPTQGTVMTRQIEKHRAHLAPKDQVSAYQHGRNLLVNAGFREYGLGYFGDIAENVVAQFSVQNDVVGFGSGAVSIVGGNYLGHTSGLLHKYIENPLAHDFKTRAAESPGVLFSMLRSGLSIYDGIKKSLWEERVGEPFEASVSRQGMPEILELLKKIAKLKVTDDKVYLPAESASQALIGLMHGSMLGAAKSSAAASG